MDQWAAISGWQYVLCLDGQFPSVGRFSHKNLPLSSQRVSSASVSKEHKFSFKASWESFKASWESRCKVQWSVKLQPDQAKPRVGVLRVGYLLLNSLSTEDSGFCQRYRSSLDAWGRSARTSTTVSHVAWQQLLVVACSPVPGKKSKPKWIQSAHKGLCGVVSGAQPWHSA